MLRITGGEHRGRKLRVPDVAATRPLVERAREGVMNHLAPLLPEAVVWDVYAGSGILGFEALSRGAARVIAIENHRRAVTQLRANAELLRLADRVDVRPIDAHRLAAADWPAPDLVFFDPPYADFQAGGARRARVWSLFCALAARLRAGGAAVVHTPKGILDEDEIARLPGLVRRDYGSTSLWWWHAPAAAPHDPDDEAPPSDDAP